MPHSIAFPLVRISFELICDPQVAPHINPPAVALSHRASCKCASLLCFLVSAAGFEWSPPLSALNYAEISSVNLPDAI